MSYRDMTEISPGGIYRQGSARQFRRAQPVYCPPPWPDTESADPRLVGAGDQPRGEIPTYVPLGRVDPRNVFSIHPA